jgi:hypothetical protein
MRAIKILLRSFPWYSAFAIGAATGWAMAGLGVAMRIGDAVPQISLASWFGMTFFQAAGLSAGRIGWMLVLEGTFLIGAVCAFALHNHWGWWSTAAAGMIAMIFFPGGTLAGILLLTAAIVRLIREKPWIRKAEKLNAASG